MADMSRMKVVVVEGEYADLCGLGLPLPLSLQLQSLNLQLSGALWSAKASASGFSVSLYWPTASAAPGDTAAKRKGARRKHQHKLAIVSATTNTTSLPAPHQSIPPVTTGPIKEHPNSVHTRSCLLDQHETIAVQDPDVDVPNTFRDSAAVDLAVQGVSNGCVSDQHGWTPVVC